MRWWYNFVFTCGFVLSAPWYFYRMARRGGWRQGFGQRFGKYPSEIKQSVTNRRVVWIHGVSVGEANLAAPIARALEAVLQDRKLIVSTTTTTGMAILKKHLPAAVGRVFYPIDFRYAVQRALGALHPDVMVLVEAELWPNMLWSLRRRGIATVLVNARISARSYRRYRLAGFLFRNLFGGLHGVAAQSEVDARRLVELGCRPEAVTVAGALKFEAAVHSGGARLDAGELLCQAGVGADMTVLVAGSTHAGEEAAVARIVRNLRKAHPRLFLVLVPRHQERGAEVGRELAAMGVRFEYRTNLSGKGAGQLKGKECMVVNTTGELNAFYQRADLVFVGKSLHGKGGQNPIEPAALGKAVVFGPRMDNFRDIAARFIEDGSAVQVDDEEGLERALLGLLGDQGRREELGRKAKATVARNQGALEKTVAVIIEAAKRVERRPERNRREAGDIDGLSALVKP